MSTTRERFSSGGAFRTHLSRDGSELLLSEDLPQLDGVLVLAVLPGQVGVVHLEQQEPPSRLTTQDTWTSINLG